jgi:HD-GYP domain-containing protein (c-di-GMP phosphodiesterase class II)
MGRSVRADSVGRVSPEARAGFEHVRSAELVAVLCLATDLGMGLPFEHGLNTTLVAMRLADRLGVDKPTATQTYYASLLAHAGCTAEAHVAAEIFGDSLTTRFHPVMYGSPREVLFGLVSALPEPDRAAPMRALQIARGLPRMARDLRAEIGASCEVASMLAGAMGVPPEVPGLFGYLTDRWDGKGPLRRARREQIPLAMRIVHVAADAVFQRLLGGAEHAVALTRERAGAAFDPEVAACLADHGVDILALEEKEAWQETVAREPHPVLALEGDEIDRALAAMGNFADLISPCLTGHSAGVAALAADAAARCGMDAAETTTVRRAGLVHDLGRVAISARIWQKPAPLNADEWEQVRLHAYHTERVLVRSPFLSNLGTIASAHHERLDGSGYHRGASGAELTPGARLLAAADAYHAMTQARPYRPAMAPAEAAEQLAHEARAGRLDRDAVAAIVETTGLPPPRLERPAGLTEREAEVIAMLARGLQTKQVARELGIAVKTADNHVQNAYRKIGVSSRAAATLFAMEHGLAALRTRPTAVDRSP